MRILWISPFAPYDTVGHGGGQNHNYYVKYIKKNTNFELTLITVCNIEEQKKVDLDEYSIDNILKVYDRSKLKTKIEVILGKIFIFRDGGLLNNAKKCLLLEGIQEYVRRREVPDIIIFQWAEALMLIDEIKMYFPKSKCIAIEEDVAYLGYKRKYEEEKGIFKFYKKKKYEYLKRKEISSLKKVDCIVSLNDKDEKLLIKEGILKQKILRMCSYHGLFENAIYNPNKYILLFYGAMSRIENYKSVIWFIKNVMPKLDERYKLYIVGSNPKEELKQYESDRVYITGYVEDIQPYFEKSLCLVAPLLLGAGIKIKVLEALSAGLPVITNDIGAEGIGLTDRINYLHCTSADDYLEAILNLSQNDELRMKLSIQGRKYVMEHFDASVSLNRLIERIETL